MRKLILLISFLLLAACGTEESSNTTTNEKENTQDEKATFLFDSKEKGIKVEDASGWTLIEEQDSNVVFENGTLKAIITVISEDNDFATLKQDLKTSAGDITVLEESDTQLSFQTNRKESIRSDISLYKEGTKTQIITFMTKVENYKSNQSLIEEFSKKIKFY
ncbi:hypothetical protein [Ornithinibacillus xuwenensis]|uniref:Lipoprotein n=1 Tax=Ornithinibacillus xuwenensis TaxID=3144668 RepID=A0ABU9XIS4_9BACI